MTLARARFVVRGQVQGVGFRPFVFTLAEEHGLSGFVRNSPRGVVIETQGIASAIDDFARDLENRLPILARITGLSREVIPSVAAERDFTIAPSSSGDTHAVLISPDTCTCADCYADITDIANRRYGYPFTNCTNCGPRYTITRSIPYDRAATSMACFPLCPDCRKEYENPRDRRFHAQPNACSICGPKVWFQHATGNFPIQSGDNAMAALSTFLLDGGIAAVKGLGGFHLVCDACNDRAVALLRERKHRPHKPFAVMAADLDEARRFASVSEEEARLLMSPEHPVVICRPRGNADGEESLSCGISPDTASVGVMLPYTPLHYILFERFKEALHARNVASLRPAALVMTSGNPGGEPICLGNREALAHLSSMADALLFHNRDILIRVDDSVVRHLPGYGSLFYRRARGYVPSPTPLEPDAAKASPAGAFIKAPTFNVPKCILGVGAELKNTLCLTKGNDAFVSQHIGDMANLETAVFHDEIRQHLASLLRVRPEAVVRDLHPDYLASRMAEEYALEHGIPVYRLQHHFAHAHAVLAEHRFRGRALVWALDGTGLGDDGTLWGGELLFVNTEGADGPVHRRVAHFAPMDLPGGEAAIREPWRIAHALLLRLGLIDMKAMPNLPWLADYRDAAALIPAMLKRRFNTPVSTSCGRLFDAVSALLGLCSATTYEGQAAIRLEEAQLSDKTASDQDLPPLPCPFTERDGMLVLDTHRLFASLWIDHISKQQGRCSEHTAILAERFHAALARGLAKLAAHAARQWNVDSVGLSGGCLQNATLARLLIQELRVYGLTPLTHHALPPGDGCISLGQAAWLRLLTQ